MNPIVNMQLVKEHEGNDSWSLQNGFTLKYREISLNNKTNELEECLEKKDCANNT